MSQTREEQEARALLKEMGATLLRDTSNSHEFWELPDGRRYSCNKPGRGKGKAWKNNLARLKRMANGTEPRPGPSPDAEADAQALDEALRNAKKKKQKHKAPHPNQVQAPDKKLGKPWDKESLAIIERMVKAGEPWEAILAEVKKIRPWASLSAIQSKARKMYWRHPKFKEKPVSAPAKEEPMAPKIKNEWTVDQLEILELGVSTDLDWEEIAKELQDLRPGVTADMVKMKAGRKRWTRPRDVPAPRVKEAKKHRRWADGHVLFVMEEREAGATIAELTPRLNEKFGTNWSNKDVSAMLANRRRKGVTIGDIRRRVHGETTSAKVIQMPKKTTKVPRASVPAKYINKEALAPDIAGVFDLAYEMCGAYGEDAEEMREGVEELRGVLGAVLGVSLESEDR